MASGSGYRASRASDVRLQANTHPRIWMRSQPIRDSCCLKGERSSLSILAAKRVAGKSASTSMLLKTVGHMNLLGRHEIRSSENPLTGSKRPDCSIGHVDVVGLAVKLTLLCWVLQRHRYPSLGINPILRPIELSRRRLPVGVAKLFIGYPRHGCVEQGGILVKDSGCIPSSI